MSLSDRYIQDRYLPDKAIDVLDEAGARMRIRNMALPEELQKIDDDLRKLRAAKESAIADQDFERAARVRDEEEKLQKQRVEAQKNWEEKTSKTLNEVSVEDVADIVSMTTGVPVSNLTEAEPRSFFVWSQCCTSASLVKMKQLRRFPKQFVAAVQG